MKKNSQIHLLIETEVIEKLKRQAQEEGISFSSLCRKKLKENSHLERLEIIIGKIYKLQEIKSSRNK